MFDVSSVFGAPGAPIAVLLLLTAAGCTAPDVEDPAFSVRPLFSDLEAASGFDFVHENFMTGARFFVEMTGAGGAFLDYDGDGDLDVYAVQGCPLVPGSSAPTPTDRLYRNDLSETGTLRFTDVTDASGLRATGYGMGAATGDVDNDGDVDLYVLNWGPNQLWRNNGDGTFTDATQPGVTDDPRWSTGASFLDFDRDGHLDLIVVNYTAYTLEGGRPCYASSGRRDYCGPDVYPPEKDRLLRNRGDGTFEDVTTRLGLARAYGPALGVVAADFNGDGWPDLYVTNDGRENLLWINQQGAGFANRAVLAGAAVNAAGMAEASMGVVAEDFDDDGDDDLFMTHLNGETNTLYLNAGDAVFEDRSRPSGLGLPSRAATAFGIAPLDADGDGLLDLLIANGEVKIISEQDDRGDPLPMRQPNQLFRNLGGGRFEDVTPTDSAFSRPEVSRGVATGDVDNDGDDDALVFNNNGPARLLRNDTERAGAWLGLRLLTAGGRDALGARVALQRPGTAPRWRRVHTDGSYASAHDPRVRFGLADGEAFDGVRVYWPGGTVEQWNDLPANRYHTLVEGQGNPVETL